jgi:NAD(P)-dependent dehydrogenase (short-subunit alcohol dehydrogenase family)
MARTELPVAGQAALITGAAKGIGAATAERLVERGVRVALIDVDAEGLAELAAKLGANAVWFEADVTVPEQLEAAMTGTVEAFGRLDVCVANAGIAEIGTAATMDPAAFERVIEVNLLGVWRTVRAALPHLVASGGYVVCVSSIAAALHLPLMGPYSASKAAVEAFANVLRTELAPDGVGVGVAYFSFVDTELVRKGFADPVVAALRQRAGRLLHDPLPLDRAAEVFAAGIAKRKTRIVYPFAAWPLIAAAGLAQPVAERFIGWAGVGAAARDAAAIHHDEQSSPVRSA